MIKSFKILSTLIFINCLYGQGLTIKGGYNTSKIRLNDESLSENIDIYFKNGFDIGIESGNEEWILGFSYLQRGSQVEFYVESYDTTGGYNVKSSDVYYYGALHFLLITRLGSGIDGFGGVQTGFPLGGKASVETRMNNENSSIDADELGVDTGFLIGANFKINEYIGLRASYYMGLTDVAEGIDEDTNYKNNTLNFSLLINL